MAPGVSREQQVGEKPKRIRGIAFAPVILIVQNIADLQPVDARPGAIELQRPDQPPGVRDADTLDGGGAGEIRIRYATLEQLDELCRKLTRA